MRGSGQLIVCSHHFGWGSTFIIVETRFERVSPCSQHSLFRTNKDTLSYVVFWRKVYISINISETCQGFSAIFSQHLLRWLTCWDKVNFASCTNPLALGDDLNLDLNPGFSKNLLKTCKFEVCPTTLQVGSACKNHFAPTGQPSEKVQRKNGTKALASFGDINWNVNLAPKHYIREPIFI